MYTASDFPVDTRIATRNSTGTVTGTTGTGLHLVVRYTLDKNDHYTGTVKPNKPGSLFSHIITPEAEPKLVAPEVGSRIKAHFNLPNMQDTFEGVVLAVSDTKLGYKIQVDGESEGVWIPSHLLSIDVEEKVQTPWEKRLAALPERTIIEYKRKPSIWAVKIEDGWFSFRGKVIEPSDGFWVLPDDVEPAPVKATISATESKPAPVAPTPYAKIAADTRRESIIAVLAKGPLTRYDLRTVFGIDHQNNLVRQYLNRDLLHLANAGKVQSTRDGKLKLSPFLKV
jgi:hypothetical protein